MHKDSISVERKKLICLGVESTAHTFGVGLASSEGTIIANVNSQYKMPQGKGIHPREAAQHHSRVAPKILEEALKQSNLNLLATKIGKDANEGIPWYIWATLIPTLISLFLLLQMSGVLR